MLGGRGRRSACLCRRLVQPNETRELPATAGDVPRFSTQEGEVGRTGGGFAEAVIRRFYAPVTTRQAGHAPSRYFAGIPIKDDPFALRSCRAVGRLLDAEPLIHEGLYRLDAVLIFHRQ